MIVPLSVALKRTAIEVLADKERFWVKKVIKTDADWRSASAGFITPKSRMPVPFALELDTADGEALRKRRSLELKRTDRVTLARLRLPTDEALSLTWTG